MYIRVYVELVHIMKIVMIIEKRIRGFLGNTDLLHPSRITLFSPLTR